MMQYRPGDNYFHSDDDEYNGYLAASSGSGGQMQEFAPRDYLNLEVTPESQPLEVLPFNDLGHISTEKLTSIPRQRQQRKAPMSLASLMLIGMLIFLMLGAGARFMSTQWISGPPPFAMSRSAPMPRDMGGPQDKMVLSLSQYKKELESQLSSVLQLSPDQIDNLLYQGQSLTDIAQNHNVSIDQLQNAELQAFKTMINEAVSAGQLDQDQANQWIAQLTSDPATLDALSNELMTGGFFRR